MVLEWLEGKSLRAVLEDGPLPLGLALRYTRELCEGLRAAHGKGVAHRDLKPENLFITSDGQLKVLDFGVARLVRPATPVSLANAPTTPLEAKTPPRFGTVGYMAPEQDAGEPEDSRVDVFGVGVVLREMLFGTGALAGDRNPSAPAKNARGIPQGVFQIIDRCLQRHPEQRYRFIHQVISALEALALPRREQGQWPSAAAVACAAFLFGGIAFAPWTDHVASPAPVAVLGAPSFEVTDGAAAAGSEAQADYLRGCHLLAQRTRHGLERAAVCFKEATRKDPSHAMAHAALARTYLLQSSYGFLAPNIAGPVSLGAARKALDLAPALGEAHTTLGALAESYLLDRRLAEEEYRKGVELSSRDATAHHWFGLFLAAPLGRFDDAEREMRLALALDPASPIIRTNLGWIYYFQRRNGEAAAAYQEVLEDEPNFSPARWRLGELYAQLGRHDLAVGELTRAVAVAGDDLQALALLGAAHARSGNREQALQILGDLHVRSRTRYVSPFSVATLLAALGEQQEALGQIERLYTEHDFWVSFVEVEPSLAELRATPGFAALKGPRLVRH